MVDKIDEPLASANDSAPLADNSVPLAGRVAVVGAGSVGSWLASVLKSHGVAVEFIARPNGSREPKKVHCTLANGTVLQETLPCGPASVAEGELDWIFVTVKAGEVENVSRQISGLITPKTKVVLFGNGLGLEETFVDQKQESLLAASVTYGLLRESDHKVVIRGSGGEVCVGPLDHQEASARFAGMLSASFRRMGLISTVVSDGFEQAWRKSVLSAGLNPVAALQGIENGELPQSAGYPLALEASREVIKVAQARGLDLFDMDVEQELILLCQKTATNRCSMLQDLDAGRDTEVDWINGAIVRAGKTHGVDTPANRLLLESMERAHSVKSEPPLTMAPNE